MTPQCKSAEYKKEILLEFDKRKNIEPLDLQLPIEDVADLRFHRIRLDGNFLSTKQFVLDNQIFQHQVGYNVITPFLMKANDIVVLVDRGWVSMGASRDVLPDVSINTRQRSIIGSVYVPYGKSFKLGNIDNNEKAWPRRIQYLDFDAMQERLSLKILPLVVRLDPEEVDGYVRQWPIFPFTSERHLGYAIQWFALTLTVIIFFLFFHLKTERIESSE